MQNNDEAGLIKSFTSEFSTREWKIILSMNITTTLGFYVFQFNDYEYFNALKMVR